MEENETKKKSKKVVKIVSIVILSIIILAGCIYIGIQLYTEAQEKKKYAELNEYMQAQEKEPEPEPEPEKTEKMLKLEELRKENDEIVGWLEIPDTNINYPVLQTDNNDYYLDHNYKKEKVATGSIFLDKDVDMDLPSSNFLIHGHRNKRGAMFEDLLKWKDESFYQEHKNITFVTTKEEAEYEILAVFYSRVYYTDEKNVFRYYFFTNAENGEEYNYYVNEAKKVSIYDTGVTAKYGEQLMTLSTCNYHTEDGRFVIVAKKVEKSN